jgi:hypothetical protein
MERTREGSLMILIIHFKHGKLLKVHIFAIINITEKSGMLHMDEDPYNSKLQEKHNGAVES